LKILALIVATEIQLFLNENHVRFPTRVHEANVHIAKRHLAIILNTDLPDLPLIAFDYVTHQSK
jgi:hypothetical protein